MTPNTRSTIVSRGGTALVVVLVVIVLLALAAYSFTSTMLTELRAVEMAARDVQARASAESGIEYAAAILGALSDSTTKSSGPASGSTTSSSATNLYHDPARFAEVILIPGDNPHRRGGFSIFAPVENDPTTKKVRNGFQDESAKLNLNTISSYKLSDDAARKLLMAIPNMTETAADSILDWIDTDATLRQYGSEDDYYQGLSPPYHVKNGPFETLEELLLVNGVTPELLYGEDANRNGILDPNEDDGDLSAPSDNADGILDAGWSAYLTVYSRESNLRSDGTPRIHVNMTLLTDLYDQLSPVIGEEGAKFITAYRINGATNVEPLPGQTGSGSTGSAATDAALKTLATGIAKAVFSGGGDAAITRGGMDLRAGGSHQIQSLYELVGAEVTATIDGNSTALTSPWANDPSSLKSTLPELFLKVSTSTAPVLTGRINVGQCRKEVLSGIPGMTTALADAIAAKSLVGNDGSPQTDSINARATTVWLLAEGLTDVTTMRQLDRFITGRGSVYRVQVIGHYDQDGPIVRREAVIDASLKPPRLILQRDLSPLGPGYRPPAWDSNPTREASTR